MFSSVSPPNIHTLGGKPFFSKYIFEKLKILNLGLPIPWIPKIAAVLEGTYKHSLLALYNPCDLACDNCRPD